MCVWERERKRIHTEIHLKEYGETKNVQEKIKAITNIF